MNYKKQMNGIYQLIGWLMFLAVPVLFVTNANTISFHEIVYSSEFILFAGLYIWLFYVHHLLLLPRLYFKKKYFIYIMLLLFLVLLYMLLKPFENLIDISRQHNFSSMGNHNEINQLQNFDPSKIHLYKEYKHPLPPPNNNFKIDIVSLILFFLLISISFAIKLQNQWIEAMQIAANREKEKTKAELEFLKAQVNPHFLFNTLNNIYALTLIKSNSAPESVLKLSNIMRYILSDNQADLVLLKDELVCINDYIDLQKLRLNHKTTLTYTVEGNMGHQKILPLLFIPFIENMFKYGYSNHEKNDLLIKFTMLSSRIIFFCRNTIFNTSIENSTGIGISNTKKRLEHHYPNKYELLIENCEKTFSVQLTIQL